MKPAQTKVNYHELKSTIDNLIPAATPDVNSTAVFLALVGMETNPKP